MIDGIAFDSPCISSSVECQRDHKVFLSSLLLTIVSFFSANSMFIIISHP